VIAAAFSDAAYKIKCRKSVERVCPTYKTLCSVSCWNRSACLYPTQSDRVFSLLKYGTIFSHFPHCFVA